MAKSRRKSWATFAAAIVLLCGGCDVVPPTVRPSWVPPSAVLKHDLKGGWIWSQCVDALTGSVAFSWNSRSTDPDPIVKVRPITCGAGSDPNEDEIIEVAKSFDEIGLWLPDSDNRLLSAELGPCPLKVSPETLEQFAKTLGSVEMSGKISKESIEAVAIIRNHIETLAPERLWFHGGSTTHLYCADISFVIPEANPSFPEHLKTGR